MSKPNCNFETAANHRTRSYVLIFLVSMATCFVQISSAFTVWNAGSTSTFSRTHRNSSGVLSTKASTITDSTTGADSLPEEPAKQFDNNNNEFREGCSVRLTTTRKAYHISVKGFGSFNPETKEFVPVGKDVERKDKCLVLPIGLVGEVQRVYDINEFDANLPIKVKFSPGAEACGGFDLQAPLLMHFDTDELEVVC